MQRFIERRSLSLQFICLAGACLLVTATAAIVVLFLGGQALHESRRYLTVVLCLAIPTAMTTMLIGVRRLLLHPLETLQHGLASVISGQLEDAELGNMPPDWSDLKQTFNDMIRQLRLSRSIREEAQRVLAQRSKTVQHLLEFTQIIQGAGLADQVYTTLAQFLETHLGLAGVAILLQDPAALPVVQVKAARPDGLFRSDVPVAEMSGGLCPCLRQNLCKEFRRNDSSIRCAIDQHLAFGPEYPAYCIPFKVGSHLHAVVHMLLPTASSWTDDQRQLAQAYVNSAVSMLLSLHLLAEAERQSMTDTLTGLYNRRCMEQFLQREVALAERHGQPLSVVMIDVDRLKEINDVHGHAAGDSMLKSFGECVRMTLRKTDLAFRYGGDEFAIALPQTPLDQAQEVVDKLRQAFAAVDFSHAIPRLERQPTLSVGLVQRGADEDLLTLEQLVTAADRALYDAKTTARNCVKVFTRGLRVA